jgi:Mrp family chromosome partitioning ATPase
MGEISEAMERAREVARREREAADAARAAAGSPAAPRDPERGAPAVRETPPERLPARELSLERVRTDADPRSLREAARAGRRKAADARERAARFFPISTDRDDHWRARAIVADRESTCAVRFPHLAVRIRAALDQARSPSLLVTSALKGEGKTTVSTNLALALASIDPDRSVALVDFDLRGASIATVLGMQPTLGIESVLAGTHGLDDVVFATDVGGLDVYPVARPRRDAHALLGRAAEGVIADLLDRYDYVIGDGPPVLPVPDTPLLAPLVGGCLVVVRSRQTRRSALRELMGLMPRATLLGVFLNDALDRKDRDAYGYYGRAPEEVHPAAAAAPPAVEETRP